MVTTQFARVLYRTDRYQQVVYFSRRDEGPYRTPLERAALLDDTGAGTDAVPLRATAGTRGSR